MTLTGMGSCTTSIVATCREGWIASLNYAGKVGTNPSEPEVSAMVGCGYLSLNLKFMF